MDMKNRTGDYLFHGQYFLIFFQIIKYEVIELFEFGWVSGLISPLQAFLSHRGNVITTTIDRLINQKKKKKGE